MAGLRVSGGVSCVDNCTVLPYILCMRIRSTRHKGLKRLIEEDDARGIRSDLAGRVRRILTALQTVQDVERLNGPPGWRVHQLTGDRAGTWSTSASGNWRVTFTVEHGEVCDLDLEDYH